MYNGKMKAVTFSYDDGVTQDKRLIEMFNKYGLKATFNINSGKLGKAGALVREGVTVAHVKPQPCEIRAIYEGHEIAAHTLTHPNLTTLGDDDIIKEVENDRLALSELAGYEVVGMAYPCGGVNCNEHVASVIRENSSVEVQAVGAGAANQAIKAIAIARGYLAPVGTDLICIPAFANVEIDGEERTAIKLICETR